MGKHPHFAHRRAAPMIQVALVGSIFSYDGGFEGICRDASVYVAAPSIAATRHLLDTLVTDKILDGNPIRATGVDALDTREPTFVTFHSVTLQVKDSPVTSCAAEARKKSAVSHGTRV